jgi:hypothetical protein
MAGEAPDRRADAGLGLMSDLAPAEEFFRILPEDSGALPTRAKRAMAGGLGDAEGGGGSRPVPKLARKMQTASHRILCEAVRLDSVAWGRSVTYPPQR